jgi:hypothetical protein
MNLNFFEKSTLSLASVFNASNVGRVLRSMRQQHKRRQWNGH